VVLKVLKDYQTKLLDAYQEFLARTRELNSPAEAFAESTRAEFGHALPYVPLPNADEVPYVCLRVPTGGGKTRLAAQAIARVNKAFLPTDNALVLWLVPSDPIREQTLYSLRTEGELLHGDLRSLFGAVHVLDIDEALYMTSATLNSANTIIVATMQSFKREGPEGLRVNRQNGALMSHFEDVPLALRGDQSLVDVIRLRRPFVVIDEAHNQGTPLAVDTLMRLRPSCVLELTATPDRASQPSNVLRSVSAATLQAEDMLKLPLELAIHPEWRVSLTEAIARLRHLENEANEERALTGESIQPVVMLIQAERRDSRETFTPDKVKEHLILDFHVPSESIAIATGALDELSGRRLGDAGYPQFIITVDKLREGWDCPYAYVLFSFRNTTSSTAVEQVLGRVLRMPNVKRKEREPLNRSYAYVVSDQLAETVQSLRDGLVQNGFERLETRDLVVSQDNDHTLNLFSLKTDLVASLPEMADSIVLPDESYLAALPKRLRDKIEISPESGTILVKGGATPEEVKAISQTFKDPVASKMVREGLDAAVVRQQGSTTREKTPAEQGIVARVPLLCIAQRHFFEIFDETPLLDADWEITDFDWKLTDSEFAPDLDTMRRAELSISQLEKIECDVYDQLDAQIALFGREQGWDIGDLNAWIDQNLYFPYSEQGRKAAWLNAAITYLLEERGFALEELAYRKFRLRSALERKMAAGLVSAKQHIFNGLIDDVTRFDVCDEHSIELRQGRYAYDTPYTGLVQLKRHFFPVIGNLKAAGEEFECAEYIANRLENVAWWVRNVEKKPGSLWLQTASDRFYPDFVVRLTSGVTLAVEYKGGHIADSADSREKRQVGDMWARRSNGRCRFIWVEKKDWQLLKKAVT
jgi:type III restriction enzyme